MYKLAHDHDDGDWILGFGLKDFHRGAVQVQLRAISFVRRPTCDSGVSIQFNSHIYPSPTRMYICIFPSGLGTGPDEARIQAWFLYSHLDSWIL